MRGFRSTNSESQNSHGNVKCSIGNGVQRNLTCPLDMNSGVGIPEGVGGAGWRGQRGKNWDNYNSIINKI